MSVPIFGTIPEAFTAPNHDPKCTRKHTVLRHAYIQPEFKIREKVYPATHYWHVINEGPNQFSTLSINGLKEWGLI